MAKSADTGTKKLISLSPTEWARWATGMEDVTASAPLDQEFQWITRATDSLVPAFSPVDGHFLMPTEIALRYNARIPARMRAYAALAEEKYGLHTVPVLAVLLPPGEDVSVPDRYDETFRGIRALQEYIVVCLWDQDVNIVFDTPLPTLLPFVPLMKGGAEEPVVRRALAELRATDGLEDLEPLLGVMAGYVMDPRIVQQIVRWDMATVRDNPFVEELKQAWLLEGEQEGVRKGRQEGKQEGEQRFILDALDARFRMVPEPVRETVLRTKDEGRLNQLHRRAVTCQTLEEFQAELGQ